MPIYEYQCQECGEIQEVLQKISDPVLKKCPNCGKLKLKKLVSKPSFRLSGTGWYETDFKTDKDKQRNLTRKDSEKKKDKKESKSKGSKPDSDKTSSKSSSVKKDNTKSSTKQK